MDRIPHKSAPLIPLKSPLELKEATIRDYMRNGERGGMPSSRADVEKLAKADLEMVDAYKRGIDLSPKLPKKRVKRDVIVPPTEMPGPQVRQGAPAKRDRPDVLYAQAHKVSQRWPFAMGRIKRIIDGATQSASNAVLMSTCECPDLALEVRRLHADYLMRGRISKHNPFSGLSEDDARRKMIRMVEDICDKSSGRLGPWWIPR